MVLCDVIGEMIGRQVQRTLEELAPERLSFTRTTCSVEYELGSWTIHVYREHRVTHHRFEIGSWQVTAEEEVVIPYEIVSKLRRATVWGRLI